ncbi:ATP-dependent endonuclease [Natrinema hispanicum]|uniref:Predicted ATP-dependent endonuclease of the OLD family, contains P-loop ATPase and TOPRIM domains n=1 Tax=Natrinema hispanicum TaxID=392421 RepID=A0A1I0F958_9EURY|nr:AAA family ATPase [Natrinema hispanicum]SET54638.1 Predicted ATP-dependent endonuclease of the OLD family, contains P-loop ATPase and TOPRIM domains [Natrinema hispanicum]
MSDRPLPLDRFSPDAHLTALEDLVKRYDEEREPIHYKKAAINLNETTCSSCLRFFSDISLIEAEKAGVYVPSKPVVDYFRKVGDSKEQARKNIGENLSEYDLFSEAQFLAKNEEFTLDELSTKVAGQLDIDKDNLGSVSTAIEIFSLFGFFKLDTSEEDPVVYTSDDGISPSQDNEKDTEVESVNLTSTQELPDNPREIEFPPTRGNPEALLDLVGVLSKGGTHSVESLTDDLDVSKRSVRGSTKYAKALGFVEETEEGFKLTDDGFELAFASEESERENLFKEAIKRCSSYRHILRSSIAESSEDGGDIDWIDSPTIRKELRTTFNFRDYQDETLRKAITTILQTAESAGLGEYIVGRGSKPTRLELSSGSLKQLDSLLSSSTLVKVEGEQSANQESTQSSLEFVEEEIVQDDFEDTEESVQGESNKKVFSQERGPAIQISEIRIQNFRNIRDTGFIELENVTTLIGKNESGKTSTLEAINSFSKDYEYTDRDLSNSKATSDFDGDIPIITLRFQLSKSLVEDFYPDISQEIEHPLTITRTKYFDNSYDSQIEASVDVDEPDLPSPNVLYYDSYDLISDKASIDQLKNGERNTFQNLLDIGEVSLDDFGDSMLAQSNAIEHAQNRIEDKLNAAWSQKSLNIDLNWVDSDETFHLMIQDQLNSGSAVDERPLTYPSQRSEGFQWFFSFYINLLAETSGDDHESKVLLLDDPAVYLHPEGKRDWLESVNEIGESEQVVFSSHSPYLIDKRYPSRIRAVEDTPGGGTKIREDIFESDNHTLEPLRNALGVDLGSSPFVSRRQLLVEGPTEYYVIAAVANYFNQVLDRDLFGWQEVSVMPVRGASNVVGQASWLEAEGIDYVIMLDSDKAGQDTYERIRDHNHDIKTDRVVLLQNTSSSENVVTEDMFVPQLYVSEFNAEYEEYTSELESSFEPASVEEIGGLSWEIGGIEYDGTRLDKVLVEYLEQSDIAEEIQNSRGEIELRKRQIAERIASRLNRSEVDENQLDSFNRLFAEIDSAMDPDV